MTPCWPEGALRAWIDHELPPAEMEQMAAHLSECRACHSLCTELEARAAHVGALIQSLIQLPDAPAPLIARPQPGHRWVPVAVALAAGLALAYYLLPQRQAPPIAVSAPPAAVVGNAIVETASVPAAASTVKATAPLRSHHTAPKTEAFIALDNEPFESGVIVRVDVPDTNVQADIVFSPDGRARAYRLIQASNRNRNKERSNE
jgi:anti-sigma factor RsiW